MKKVSLLADDARSAVAPTRYGMDLGGTIIHPSGTRPTR